MKQLNNNTCIKITGPFMSQNNGNPITRGDMITFYILMDCPKNENDIRQINIDDYDILLKLDSESHHIKAIDIKTNELIAEIADATAYYNDWAKQPTNWIGWGYIVNNIKDL